MRRVLLVEMVVAGAALSLSAALASDATAVTPARIIDRSFLCRVSGTGFPDAIRFLRVSAAPFDPAFEVAPQIGVFEGIAGGTPGWGAHARTGPAGEQNQEPTGQVTAPRIAAGRCTNTRLRVPLSSNGLRGGPVDRLEVYRCDAPAKVLVRIRALFKRPTRFRVDPGFPEYEKANGNITVSYLAVTTLRGRRPMAFALAQDKGGKARLFVARSGCVVQQ